MMKLLVVLSPVPALCCLQFVGYWKISPTTDKKIREELMVFLCHYRNKLIFGFKSEGWGQWRVRATCCVRGRKQRDGTVTSKLSQGNACALELSTGYLDWCSPCHRRWECRITQKLLGVCLAGQNECCWDMDVPVEDGDSCGIPWVRHWRGGRNVWVPLVFQAPASPWEWPSWP